MNGNPKVTDSTSVLLITRVYQLGLAKLLPAIELQALEVYIRQKIKPEHLVLSFTGEELGYYLPSPDLDSLLVAYLKQDFE